jgi:hypothetical protein
MRAVTSRDSVASCIATMEHLKWKALPPYENDDVAVRG